MMPPRGVKKEGPPPAPVHPGRGGAVPPRRPLRRLTDPQGASAPFLCWDGLPLVAATRGSFEICQKSKLHSI